jgi:hypothetical protein
MEIYFIRRIRASGDFWEISIPKPIVDALPSKLIKIVVKNNPDHIEMWPLV